MKRLLVTFAAVAAIPAAADFRYSRTHLQVYSPGTSWALTLPREDWRVLGERRNDRAAYVFAADPRGFSFSAYIDKTTDCTSAAACRRLWKDRKHPSMEGATVVQESERNGFSFLVYEVRALKVGEKVVGQTNVSAHAYRDGHWIDFRASSVGEAPPPAGPLLALLDKLAFAAPDLQGPRRYPFEERFLELDVPPEWRDELAAGRVPTVRFTPPTGKDFLVLMSMVPLPGEAPPDWTLANMRKAAEVALARSVEKTIEPVPFQTMVARGHYFTATDKAPGPGGFRHMTQGEVVTGNATVTFTILTNDGGQKTAQAALETMKGIRIRSR